MPVGSNGVLYCVETRALTTPFLVYSGADAELAIENVWSGRWVLPFKIHPLGTPDRQLSAKEAVELLPVFDRLNTKDFSKVFHVKAVTAFAPTEIGADDWEILLHRLAI